MINKKMTTTVTNESAQMRHPGWDATLNSQSAMLSDYDVLFDATTIAYIKGELAKLLRNIAPRPIVVAEHVIRNVLESVYSNNRPAAIGDIYGRYHMEGLECERTFDINKQVHEVIEIIYNYIKNEHEISECNKKMSVWSSVYGTYNEQGLRAHPPIKLLDKHPARMQFNMNY